MHWRRLFMTGSYKIKKIIDLALIGILLSVSITGLFANFYYNALHFICIFFGASALMAFILLEIIKRTIYLKILNLTSSILYLLMVIGSLVELSFEGYSIIFIILIVTFASLKTISETLDLILFGKDYKKEEKGKIRIALSIFFSLFLFFFLFVVNLFSRILFYISISDNFSAFWIQSFTLFIFLPITIVLLIITIVLELISLRKKNKKDGLLFILFTLIFCSMVIPSSLLTSKSTAREYGYFTIEKWKKAECPQRKYLMISFLKQYDVVGWNNEELIEYINSPTTIEDLSNLECSYLYKVEEIEYSDNRYQVEYVCFDFSEELKIVNVRNDFRYESKAL